MLEKINKIDKFLLEDLGFGKMSLVVDKERVVINLWRKKFFVVFKIFEEFDFYVSEMSMVLESLVVSKNFVDGVLLCVRCVIILGVNK